MTSGNVPKISDRIEWNPTGDVWEPGKVMQAAGDHLEIQLDDNGQSLIVERRHCRPVSGDSEASVA